MRKSIFRKVIAYSHIRKAHMTVSGIEALMERQAMLMDVYLPATKLHSTVFPKYKNRYQGKDIVIVAGGPSSEKYVPIKDAVHIAVNLSVNRKDINYDYFFSNDFSISKLDLFKQGLNNESMTKFLGIAPYENIGSAYSQLHDNANVEFYYWDDCLRYTLPWSKDLNVGKFVFPIELDTSPLKVYGTTVHAALQFALWVNPNKIYLVGTDCTSIGHANGIGYQKLLGCETDDFSRLIDSWKQIANHIQNYYPQIEVISVNPVGLKGIFKDINM